MTLEGRQAHDFLEKLVYLVLPAQNAFDGLLMKQLDRAGGLHFRCAWPGGLAPGILGRGATEGQWSMAACAYIWAPWLLLGRSSWPRAQHRRASLGTNSALTSRAW